MPLGLWNSLPIPELVSAGFCHPILEEIPGFLSLDKIFNQLVSFVKNDSLF